MLQKIEKMNKKLGSPRIFSYICPQNCNFVALLDIVGITERYACLTVVKPRKLSHINPDDNVISPHCFAWTAITVSWITGFPRAFNRRYEKYQFHAFYITNIFLTCET